MRSEASGSRIPETLIQPFKRIWAIKSMMPDPQIPTGFLSLMVVYVSNGPEICTESMAPSVARMPYLLMPPSKAGPAAPAPAIRKS